MHELCKEYGALPEAGGVMDQPIWWLRQRAILQEAGYFDEQGEGGAGPRGASAPAADPLVNLPMSVG